MIRIPQVLESITQQVFLSHRRRHTQTDPLRGGMNLHGHLLIPRCKCCPAMVLLAMGRQPSTQTILTQAMAATMALKARCAISTLAMEASNKATGIRILRAVTGNRIIRVRGSVVQGTIIERLEIEKRVM